MRMVWTVLLCGTLSLSGRVPAAAGSPPLPGISATAGISPLLECRLEHPLRIAAVAARCGILTVPEDPAHPGGATIDLSVAVVPALNRRATAAPLFLLAGGPGQAATDLYASYAGAFARVNRNHDIVLVDQRGTGRSAPLKLRLPRRLAKRPGRDAAAASGDSRLPREIRAARALLHHQHSRRRPRQGARGAGLCAYRPVRLIVRHACGGALHAALPGQDARGGSRRGHLSGAGHRTGHTLRR